MESRHEDQVINILSEDPSSEDSSDSIARCYNLMGLGLDRAYLNRSVRIVNQDGGRTLYAQTGANGQVRVGAGPSSQVTAGENWFITQWWECSYRIVNAASHRALYANRGGNWQNRFGAGLREDYETDSYTKQYSDGTCNEVNAACWKITQNPNGSYRIVNAVSQRCLYTHPAGTLQERVGAGYPETEVGTDGCWT